MKDAATTAFALVTAAAQIDPAIGETSADLLADMVRELVTDEPAGHVADVIIQLAAYGAIVVGMVAMATETDPGIIHQEMALAIAETEEH